MKPTGLSWNQAELINIYTYIYNIYIYIYIGDLISEVYDIVHLTNIFFCLDCDNQKFNFSVQSGKQTNEVGNKKKILNFE